MMRKQMLGWSVVLAGLLVAQGAWGQTVCVTKGPYTAPTATGGQPQVSVLLCPRPYRGVEPQLGDGAAVGVGGPAAADSAGQGEGHGGHGGGTGTGTGGTR